MKISGAVGCYTHIPKLYFRELVIVLVFVIIAYNRFIFLSLGQLTTKCALCPEHMLACE